jgi:hypothetical protein
LEASAYSGDRQSYVKYRIGYVLDRVVCRGQRLTYENHRNSYVLETSAYRGYRKSYVKYRIVFVLDR